MRSTLSRQLHSFDWSHRPIVMSTRLAVLLLMVEFSLLVLTAQVWIFALMATAAALGVVVARRNDRFIPIKSHWIVSLAVLCVLKLLLAPHDIAGEYQFIHSQFAHELARFLIGCQLLLFASRDFVPRRAALFLQLGWGVLILSCDVRVPDYRVHLIQIALAVAIVLQVLFAMSTRRTTQAPLAADWTRHSMSLLTVFVAVIAGSALAAGIARHERQLEWLLTNYLFPDRSKFNSTGYSGRGSLESITMWQQFESDEVVLRGVSDESPGYVIGRVFDTFNTRGQRSEWSTSDAMRELAQAFHPPAEIDRPSFDARLFGAVDSESPRWRQYEIWSQSRNRLFVPLDTALVAVQAAHLIYTDGSYSALDRPDSGELHYAAYVPSPAPPVHLQEEQLTDCLRPYDELDPEAAGLAEQIFNGCTTTEDKCLAVERYLQENFQYSRNVIRPRGKDQLSDFLLHNRQGHCEYFATAAALLLRLGGVPTRYASGYLMIEQNSIDGSWISRNSHAHAWALAFDAELQRWRIVEATPPDGIPEVVPGGWWESHQLAWSLSWKRWLGRTHEFGLLPALGSFVSEHWLIPLISVLIAVGLTLLLRRRAAPAEVKQSKSVATPPKLAKVLKIIDRAAWRRGLMRSDAETLQSFAKRIHDLGLSRLAAAYREYARVRYSRTLREQDLVQLSARVRQHLTG